MTTEYRYERLWLWEPEAWADRYSPVRKVAERLMMANHATRPATHESPYAGRTDGVFDAKTHAVTYPDVVARLAERGLEYICDELGQMSWIALLPADRGDDDPPRDLMLVLLDADYTEPNWAMDLLAAQAGRIERASEQGQYLLFAVPDGVDHSHMWATAVQELAVRFHLAYTKVLLDTEAVGEPGSWTEITGQWQDRVSHAYQYATAQRNQQGIHLSRLIHSETGRRLAEAMAVEHRFDDPLDPEFARFWEEHGVSLGVHQTRGHRWVTLAPRGWERIEPGTLPVMLVFQEVTAMYPFQTVAAMASYFEYVPLVAADELMLVFFALESVSDNDVLAQITRSAATRWPIDSNRVYITGHSHNGHFALAFMRRHPDLVAAAATLGNAHGLPAPRYSHEAVKVTDSDIDLMAGMDIPVINIAGVVESDFLSHEPGSAGFADALDSWRRRATAFGLPCPSDSILAAARAKGDYPTRRIGVPGDHTDVQLLYGTECYLSDHYDTLGRLRLRLVTLDNLPHMCAPQMPGLAWDFVRRFAKDPNTGAVIDRYR
jgi:pimeloyl-ACP methyl ester carboxylesterase